MSAEATPARIETAAGLFAALRSPDMRLRVGVIGGLARDPRAGVLLGRHEGRDIIDALIDAIAAEPAGSGLGRPMAQVLSAYADPRVLAFFTRLLGTAEFDRIEVAASYLARTAEGRDGVRALLFDIGQPQRAQAAARALLGAGVELSGRERVRAALLDGRVPPLVDTDTLPLWLEELAGPLRRRALGHVGAQDEAGLRLLAGAWERLDGEARLALLRAARERGPAAVLPVLPAALAGDPATQLAALECLAALGAAGDEIRPPLSAFLGSADPALLAAALAVARLDVDPRPALLPGQDPRVRCAALRRVAQEDLGGVPLLVDALADREWAVRACAAQLLSARGPAAREAMQPLAAHEDPAVRLAAAQVLAALTTAQAGPGGA